MLDLHVCHNTGQDNYSYADGVYTTWHKRDEAHIILCSDPLPVTPGQDYIIRFDIRVQEGANADPQIRLVVDGVDGARYIKTASALEIGPTAGDDFITYELDFTAPDSAAVFQSRNWRGEGYVEFRNVELIDPSAPDEPDPPDEPGDIIPPGLPLPEPWPDPGYDIVGYKDGRDIFLSILSNDPSYPYYTDLPYEVKGRQHGRLIILEIGHVYSGDPDAGT